ncbi:Uncharacterised protein [Mycobacteroides abscessus subsp. abscessus]|nr:Uncharacterised protein [Mycobacteroides abscessus subsp. abscessus]
MTSLSPNRIRPEVGLMNPAIIRRVVDLPHPEGPSRVKNSPSAMVSDSLSTDGVEPA